MTYLSRIWYCIHMAQKDKRTNLLILLSSFLMLAVFLMSTNPESLPIGFVFLPVILLYICLFLGGKLLYEVLGSIRNKASRVKENAFAMTFALIPTVLLLLRSINQLTPKDLFLVSLLGIVLVFYISVLKFGKPKS